MTCEDMKSNKELILTALKSLGYNDSDALAECIKNGRVHIGGCIPINEQVNEVLCKILNGLRGQMTAPEAREIYDRLHLAIKAGMKAKVRYNRCSSDLHGELYQAEHGIPNQSYKQSKLEKITCEIRSAEQKLEHLIRTRDMLER